MTSPWTLVTAYLPGVNNRKPEDYLTFARSLFASASAAGLPQVVFADPSVANELEVGKGSLTRFVRTQFKDLYLAEHVATMKPRLSLSTPTPEKDTLEYLMVQCHKTEWMVQAAEVLGDACSPNLLWADISIDKFRPSFAHPFSIEAYRKIAAWMPSVKGEPRVRIPHIWPLRPLESGSAVERRSVAWYFAGGVFGGPRRALERFASLAKEHHLSALQEGWFTWEVNFWAMLYKRHPGLFDPYQADHNASLLGRFVP